MTKDEGLNILKKICGKTKAFLFSRNVFVFLFFIIISTVFWAVLSLNKVFDRNFSIPVKYVNVPKDIEFSADLPPEVSVKLKDRGTVLWTLFDNPDDSLVFDFARYSEVKKNNKTTLRTASVFESQIKSRIPTSTTIIDYDPSSIIIEKGALKSKKVTVSLKHNITCDDQFCYSDSIKIKPRQITLYAPADLIDNIDTVYTENLMAKDLTDTLVTNVNIILPYRCKAEQSQVEVTVPVEIYIEGSMDVPVKVINVPSQYSVKTMPTEVTVKYNIGKSKFGKILPSSFQLYIDYNDIIDSNSKKQYIIVGKTPVGIINYKLSPESVEYVVM